jgi:hypothetical protein
LLCGSESKITIEPTIILAKFFPETVSSSNLKAILSRICQGMKM